MLICDCCFTQLGDGTAVKVVVGREVVCCPLCRVVLEQKAEELLVWMVTGRVAGAAWAEGMTLEQVARVGAWFHKTEQPLPATEPTVPDRKELGQVPHPRPTVPCFSCSATGKVKTVVAPGAEPVLVACPGCGGTGRVGIRSLLPDQHPLPPAEPTVEDRKHLGFAVPPSEWYDRVNEFFGIPPVRQTAGPT